jgi:hypothetical protein
MGLLDELLKAQKPKRNLMGTQMVRGPDQPYLRQDYPTVYGALGGLLGTAPDEMAGSVLDPSTAAVRRGAEYGFPVGTALGMLPVAPAAQRGAMVVGRAGERLAERAVPQVMNRGGLLAEMLQGMGRGTVSPLDVYHGTPHTLPPTPRNPLGEFDASKIGTGEGSQSYGHGIYTAEARPVAEEYVSKLSKPIVDFTNTQPSNELEKALKKQYEELAGRTQASGRAQAVYDLWTQHANPVSDFLYGNSYMNIPPMNPEKLARRLEIRDAAKKLGPPISGDSGNLYKVNLPDEKIAQMIDYDKPMAEQRNLIEKMRKALVGPDSPLSRVKQFEINETLNDSVRMRNLYPQSIINLNEPQIVDRLRQVGIPGIKYFDEGSRNLANTWIVRHPQGGENVFSSEESAKEFLKRYPGDALIPPKVTRNFVTFPGEEQNLRILERNSQKAPDILANPIDEEELRRRQ